MPEDHSATIEVNPQHSNGHQGEYFSPDATMLILTWVTFFLLLAVLHKFAWKPILAALDQREKDIQKSVENADKLKEELANMENRIKQKMAEAEDQGKRIIEESKKAAGEAARHIQSMAKEESKILLENARQEINEEKEKAQADLRLESAEIAVKLAEKILEENLDKEKNKRIINEYLKET